MCVVPREQDARAEEIEELGRLLGPPHELGNDIGLVLWPWCSNAENVPRACEEERAPDDGEEEPQWSADHGGIDRLDEIISATFVEERDGLFGDHVARDHKEYHDSVMTTREENPENWQSRGGAIRLCYSEQWMAVT